MGEERIGMRLRTYYPANAEEESNNKPTHTCLALRTKRGRKRESRTESKRLTIQKREKKQIQK